MEEKAMPKQGEAGKPTLLDNLVTLWPGIRYLSLGIWISWVYLFYGGTIGLSANELDGSNLVTVFLISTITATVVFLLAPLCPRFFTLILASRDRVILFSLSAVLGSFLIIFAGPHYLHFRELSFLGAFLNGIGMTFLLLKLGCLYGMLKPRTALTYAALSLLLAPLVYFFVLGNGALVPLEGSPALGSILAFIFLPLLVAVLATIPLPPQLNASPYGTDTGEQPIKPTQVIRLLPPAFWRFMVAIFVFTIATSMVRSFVAGVSPPSATTDISSNGMLLLFIFSLAVFFYAIHFLQQVNLGKLYMLLMVILVALLSASPLLDITETPMALLIGFVFDMFDFLVWCLLAFIAFRKRISPLIVFGLGNGVFMAAMSAGWYFGANLMPTLTDTSLEVAIYVGLAVAVLLVVTLVFHERDIDKMLTADSVDLPEQQLDQLQAVLSATRQSSEETRNPDRPFNQACKLVGQTARLSEREQDIFEQLALGRRSEAIAKRLNLSLNTVRSHTHNIYAKLDVHSRQKLIELVETECQRRPPSSDRIYRE
jgi:DNA-binding CsgD family transcriptional regulator